MAVNADFAKQAMFVAQQLECSERYAAGLLHTVLVQNPNVSPIDSIEYTLLEYHTYRRHLSTVYDTCSKPSSSPSPTIPIPSTTNSRITCDTNSLHPPPRPKHTSPPKS
jgi:hypothetical protein